MTWSRGQYLTGSLSDEERERNEKCAREHRDHWTVAVRKANYSTFNGSRRTPSDYSEVHCTKPGCRRVWRTKAKYVDTLPDAD